MSASRRQSDVCFTLDVLTDGSEYTGCGSIFLSVWKKPTSNVNVNVNSTSQDDKIRLEESMALDPPLSRYAIAGIGDLTARLSADQRFKLASTRCVFTPSCGGGCLDGLSALLLALRSAGAPSLHIISTQGEVIEELASIVLGTRRNLNISHCQVPTTTVLSQTKQNDAPSSTSQSWWQVYDDPYIIVHASRRSPNNEDEVTYLFSMRHGRTEVMTLAVIPPESENVHRAYLDLLAGHLPLLHDTKELISIDMILALSPRDMNWSKLNDSSAKVLTLCTFPDKYGSTWDPGILIRSQQVAQHLSNHLPRLFSNNGICLEPPPCVDYEGTISPLCSSTSVLLGLSSTLKPVVLDRRTEIWEKPLSDEWASTISSLKKLVPLPGLSASSPCPDENEIDLDEEEGGNEEADQEDPNDNVAAESLTHNDPPQIPQLHVLGTGCATPSAIRGASGYALSFPICSSDAKFSGESAVFILDCGEGVTTMLARHGPKHWMDCIHGIWISHAHLDHYGGLPTLLRTITKEADTAKKLNDPDDLTTNPKRQKKSQRSCCWVMAPSKVLRYLDLLLGCHHGRRRSDGRQLFDPRLHHDPTIPAGPWIHFQNIKVRHNCFPAYALLLGWRQQQVDQTNNESSSPEISWFCFSGDTRPCDALVRACRTATVPPASSSRTIAPLPLARRFFLLHEATFEEGEREQAERKMHSTFSEAMAVARDIGATRVLLTHFSQRYVSLQTIPVHDDEDGSETPLSAACLAVDGLRVPLV